jgi:hypothetical protein
MDVDVHMRRVIDNLSVDLNSLSSEAKRKFTPVKEVFFSSFFFVFKILMDFVLFNIGI